ncbi:inorganic phosphate transporter [uncultured Olsenella sp.]|uniref:inorganic phosphate transporter n=1 Tax=uncultured Olsenella sp. TaxID=190764 RepID=UPI0026DD0CBC|nr:inorganic phosphate transporter [uncultured Olsenella sp.]
MPSPLLVAVLVIAFAFEFINGFHDTANAIATTVYTRALSPRVAILSSAAMNFVGALTSEKVAMTIATGLVSVQLGLHVILAALLGAVAWDLFTWWFSIPSSSSHALIGSLIGATMVFTGGPQDVIWEGVVDKVVIPLFTSPLIGLALGFVFMNLAFEAFADVTAHNANSFFHKAQVASSMFMAYSHGNNDAQKTMGIITIALVSAGMLDAGAGVPLWVKVLCAAMMALGTAIGGQRIMKTVGQGVTKLEPAIGFVCQTASAIAIEAMTALGAPVSTTQVLTTSIMGAGSAKGIKNVRWGVAGSIVTAWVVTLPATMCLGALFALVAGRF